MTKYKLLALDVDGTLVGPDSVVSDETARAVAAAQRAGLRVCLATGRTFPETLPVWRQLGLREPIEPLVVLGGAMVSEAPTGRTLYHRPIPRDLAGEFSDALGQEGYCAMAVVDAWRCGVDYYVTTTGNWQSACRLWFSKIQLNVKYVPRLSEAGDLPHPLRISTVVEADRAAGLAGRLQERFGGRLTIHSILAPNYGAMMVEAHVAGADKFSGLKYVTQGLRISAAHVVAAGDDINDLSMIRGAGLGVAMAKAPDFLKAAAAHTATEGLAAFIHALVEGRFDGNGRAGAVAEPGV